MMPLKFGGIPELESTVSAYGYPIGGERMSVTTGIVSRIDFQLYTHSSIDQHLAIQISAQINPGQQRRAGDAECKSRRRRFPRLQRRCRARRRLHDPDAGDSIVFSKTSSDGRYDRYVDLGLTYSKLQNPAQRRFSV